MQRRLAALALLAAFVLPAAGQDSPRPRPWEFETSDLAVDPRLHFGSFPNGVRWVWARNAEPKFRSVLRLHVNAGSLCEEDSERGMAHFLEHMAFNGSEHYPAGTLVEWFQRHGMAFGADLNAHTDFGETTYELDLPESNAQMLDEALLVLHDFATGLKLEQDEIDKEKGVIDGEEVARDSAGYRLFVRQIESVLGESRLDERIPIGVSEIRAKFTSDALRAFYRRWYRPENLTVVLVGDLGDLDPVALFEKHFATLVPPPGKPAVDPGPGKVTHFAHRLCLSEPELPSVSLRIEKLRAFEDRPFDSDRMIEETPLAMAREMLELRFRELVKKPDAPFLSADVTPAQAFEVIDGESLDIDCAPEKWREALTLGEQELRRALEHGFQAPELDEVRANAVRALHEAVDREPTQTSAGIANEVLAAAEHRYVPTSAATRLTLLEPIYQKMSAEDCHAALVEAWTRGELSLLAAGALDLGSDAKATLDGAWEASRGIEVEKGAEIVATEFAYPPAPVSKELLDGASRGKIDDLDVQTVTFANGVTLSVKKTDFKEKQILYRAVLGEGKLSLPKESQAVGWLTEHVFTDGGLGKHSVDELRRVLAGKQVSSSFSVGIDTFDFSGATTREDLALQCALVCAYLTDPGWREDGYLQVKRELPLMYKSLEHQHQGPILFDFMSALFGGDRRFAFFAEPELESVELPAMRAWVDPFLADGPLDITLVGDLDPDEAIAAVATTFGRLPRRRALRSWDEHRDVPAPLSGVHQVHAIDTQVPKSLFLAVFPVPDELDAARAVRFQFLTEVLRDRLRIEVRERLGAAYSPVAALQQSETFPGVGLLMIQAVTEPDKVQSLQEACLTVTDALARDGVTSEEVDRLRGPVLENLRDSRRQNGWWLAILSRSQRRPSVLDDVRAQTERFQAVTAEELTALAKQYLPREKASGVIVNPAEVEVEPVESDR